MSTSPPTTSPEEVSLDKLRPYLSTQNFNWVKRDDEERNILKQKIADECPGGHLFAEEEDEDESPPRVQEWTSSRSNVDGHGGYQVKEGAPVSEEDDEDAVTVVFLLSESYDGFGDTLWYVPGHARVFGSRLS